MATSSSAKEVLLQNSHHTLLLFTVCFPLYILYPWGKLILFESDMFDPAALDPNRLFQTWLQARAKFAHTGHRTQAAAPQGRVMLIGPGGQKMRSVGKSQRGQDVGIQ